jgi:hypothetical protein
VIDVAAIPNRFEYAVGEPEHQDVLHGFLAEIMINAVDLPIFQGFIQFYIQGTRRFHVVSERLFNNGSPPKMFLFFGQADNAQLTDNFQEEGRGRG